MKTSREVTSRQKTQNPTPLLDMDFEAGDSYLVELARRASISDDQSQQDAVLHWVN